LALRWRTVTLTLSVVLLTVIAVLYFKDAKVEFIPETDPRTAYIDIDCPEGTKLEVTDKIVRQVEEIVKQYGEDVEFIIGNVGSRGVSMFGGGDSGSSHIGRVSLDFPKLGTAKTKPSEIVRHVRTQLDGITGAKVYVKAQEQGPDSKPPVNVEISGDEFTELANLSQKIQELIKGTPNLVDVRDDYEKGKPEILVKVDRQQALLTGLNTAFIGQTVLAAINGRKAGDYREGDEEYDVTVRFPKIFRENLANLESLSLVNLQGHPVPFSSVAHLEQGTGLGTVTRIDRKRTVTVMGEVQGRPGPEVLKDVQKTLADFPLPQGYTLSYTGANEEHQESQAFLFRAFVAALFLIALVLVLQFNSVIQPLIIMSSVILSLTGVFLGLMIHKMPFDVIMGGIGCMCLAGIVVNNAIVLLDFINVRRRQGASVNEALVDAGTTRFRPVMLTAICTLFGLIPMAVGVSFDFVHWKWMVGGESSQWWGPLAIVVIYGLAFATLLTLVVVPVLYSLTESFRSLFLGRKNT
jgi:multidrug efflux pump